MTKTVPRIGATVLVDNDVVAREGDPSEGTLYIVIGYKKLLDIDLDQWEESTMGVHLWIKTKSLKTGNTHSPHNSLEHVWLLGEIEFDPADGITPQAAHAIARRQAKEKDDA